MPNFVDLIPFLVTNAFWILLGVAIILAVSAIDWVLRQVKRRLRE